MTRNPSPSRSTERTSTGRRTRSPNLFSYFAKYSGTTADAGNSPRSIPTASASPYPGRSCTRLVPDNVSVGHRNCHAPPGRGEWSSNW
ncbi:Uncharacterised protein [Mycobacteroides abscessus subsp. abscessus]|nr:Uncharacterised protein [Mycobacteroides abscessus subsp. abscessus]